jgi:hypothetical protein
MRPTKHRRYCAPRTTSRAWASAPAHLEPLEARQFLSASLASGILTIAGTPADDSISIALAPADPSTLTVTINGSSTPFAVADVQHIVVTAGRGNDRVAIDQSNGVIAISASLHGGQGNDMLISGCGDDDLRGGQGDDRITGGAGHDTLFGGNGNDTLNGGPASDELAGGAGTDVIRSQGGHDLFHSSDAPSELADRKPLDYIDGRSIAVPPVGQFYHSVFPGGTSGAEDDITPQQVQSYEQSVGAPVAWVYFSDNWYQGRAFPEQTAEWIRSSGSVPFIRLMLRSQPKGSAESTFTLDAIIAGQFDQDLTNWAQQAKAFGSPLIVEWGTECNGDWFSWNGAHNGAGDTTGFGDPAKADGPERFVAAYRHIVNTMRAAGADNIAWVFHVNTPDWPDDAAWNHLENYYPGDDVVDWVAVSDYGTQRPTNPVSATFRDRMDAVYPRLTALAPGKPIMIAEFGCAANTNATPPDQWAQGALDDLFAQRWPQVRALSWWDENWHNDDNPDHNTTMKVDSIPALADVFRSEFASHGTQLVTRPVFLS